MAKTLRAPSALLIAALIAALAGSPAYARSPGSGAKDAPQNATQAEHLSTGSIDASARDKKKRRFDDCMAIWEPRTHMTKREWRRTCKSTLEGVPERVPEL